MRRSRAGLVLVGLTLLLTGCTLLALPPAAERDAPAELGDDALALAAGDVIRLTVYGEEVLTGEYPIHTDGSVAIPLIGRTQAAGLSREALKAQIAEALARAGYMTSPQVTVDMASRRPVYVLGEVKTAGQYSWQPHFTVLQAVASAGGYTPRAAKGMALIDRLSPEGSQHLNAVEATPVLPGDSITVRERIF